MPVKKAAKNTTLQKAATKVLQPPPPKNSPLGKMLSDLHKSGLNPSDAKKMMLVPMTTYESTRLKLSRDGDGYVIPYFDSGGNAIAMFRYRYFETVRQSGITVGAKMRKYDQPVSSDPEVYFPPLLDWSEIVEDPSYPIIITEGEKKAACACHHKMACLGVGGVYSFARAKRFQKMLPALEEIKWRGRIVYICYDSDAITNRKVLIAEDRLARALTDEGALVYIIRLPQEGEEKVGLDDYIVEAGLKAFERLMEEAEEWGPTRELHRLNTEVIHINYPSMVMVYPKEDHPKNQPRYRTISVHTYINELFKDRKYMLEVEGKDKDGKKIAKQQLRYAAKDWIEWAARSQADSMDYSPGQDRIINGTQFNTWEGWGATPAQGDVTLFLQLIDAIFDVPEDKRWFLQWLAYPIQNPGVKMNTAVVLWSTIQGSGKSLIGYTMERVYGKNFAEVNKEQLSGSFNGWAVNRQFVMGDEITGSNTRETADILKGMVTGLTVTINAKYQPIYSVRNCINYYFTSNHQDAFFVTGDDRRYFVHEIQTKMSKAFFDAYDKWYKTEAAANALMYYFLYDVDVDGFSPTAAAPVTAAKKEMVEANLSEIGSWVAELKENPDNVLRAPTSSGPDGMVIKHDLWTLEELLSIYLPEGSKRRPISAQAVGRVLKEHGFKKANFANPVNTGKGRRQHLWCIRRPDDIHLNEMEAGDKYQRERGNFSAPAKPQRKYNRAASTKPRTKS